LGGVRARPPGRARPGEDAVPDPTPAVETVTVRSGDSLWRIAAAALPGAEAAEIVAYVAVLHDRNRAVIGDDPDLILPGQRLELPTTGRNDR
jgi:nucleoid-associated protein YgaU